MDSVFEQSEKQGPQVPQQAAHTRDEATLPQSSASEDNWDAFGPSTANWSSTESANQGASVQQTVPSASWAAFDDSSGAAGHQQQAETTGSLQQSPEQQSGYISKDESMQAADFGGSNYWRTHPLALVDEIE